MNSKVLNKQINICDVNLAFSSSSVNLDLYNIGNGTAGIFYFIFQIWKKGWPWSSVPKEGRRKMIESPNLQQTSGEDMTCLHQNLQSAKAWTNSRWKKHRDTPIREIEVKLIRNCQFFF